MTKLRLHIVLASLLLALPQVGLADAKKGEIQHDAELYETLTLRLTEDQRAEIVREATEKGFSLSDVVRARIFGPGGSPDCMPGGRRLMNTEGELEA